MMIDNALTWLLEQWLIMAIRKATNHSTETPDIDTVSDFFLAKSTTAIANHSHTCPKMSAGIKGARLIACWM